jgi:dihydropteroate synthase
VREIDIARRLMHYAVTQKAVPKHVDDRLVTLKDPRLLSYSEAELREFQAEVKDPNFRIFADHETITVFNHELFVRGSDIQAIFDALGVDDASHAFYLGKELAKARLAIQLGKTYRQEGQLNWGYLTPPEDPNREHFRPRGRRPAPPAEPADG